MTKLTSFLTALLSSLLLMTISSANATTSILFVMQQSPNKIETMTDLTGLIKLVLSTFGGILATIILAFLKKKFPDLFGDALADAKAQLKKVEKPK